METLPYNLAPIFSYTIIIVLITVLLLMHCSHSLPYNSGKFHITSKLPFNAGYIKKYHITQHLFCSYKTIIVLITVLLHMHYGRGLPYN